MTSRANRLEVKNIRKNYEGAPLLRGVSLSVESGETLCLLGRSGSGKSTLLRIIAGLESADEGEVLWNGENLSAVPTWQRRFGLMFQDYALFPHLSVEENVAFGLRMQGMRKADIQTRVASALELVNMSAFVKRRVTDLSGGEQQRIALARALAPQPRLLMLDEPLAALDRALRTELQEELRALLHKTGIPAVYVTHDQEEAFMLGDRIAILAVGIVAQEGSPEEVYRRPKDRKVAEFLGMSNFLAGRVISLEPLRVESRAGIFTPGVCTREGIRMEEEVTLLLPSDLRCAEGRTEELNTLSGVVQECVFRGQDYKVRLSLPGGLEMEFILADPQPVDQPLTLKLDVSSIICLGSEAT